MIRLKHSIFVLGILLISAVLSPETDLKEQANKLFEKEQYVEATPLFSRLLSLSPKDVDYNFKFGTCLLFNANRKTEGLKYLNFAVKQTGVDARAFYFRGRAFHLNYQFEDAKKMYRSYLKRRDKKDMRYDVERSIEMCDNGKRLLTTFTDIIVSEKKEIDDKKFFRLYHDMQSIGGDILVAERFQSKLDKKKGHTPIVHFPKNAKAVYYSSYGDNESSGLDIYVRKKLPDGSWGIPQRVPGMVNTEYDENFPYMHPNGNYLYFSSKGHNSMGGYDVFMARFDPASNGFERIENVDFAISSPDDDLFYVVDSLYQNAYFASARQSAQGKLHVYRVKVARVPIKEVIIMGDFLSEINPENKQMYVSVTSSISGEEVGKIQSNAAGKYSFVFPRGGKYKYSVEIDGMDETTEIDLEVPFLDEFRPLKQKIVHTTVEGNEVVKIVNLFDETVEGGEALIASVIRKKAALDVNIGDFDLKEIEALQKKAERDAILVKLGMSGMSPEELSEELKDLREEEEALAENLNILTTNMDAEILDNGEIVQELSEERADLLKQADLATNPADKHGYLTEAAEVEAEMNRIIGETAALESTKAEVLSELTHSGGNNQLKAVEEEYNRLLAAGETDEALDYLVTKDAEIKAAKELSVQNFIDAKVEESIAVSNEVKELKQKKIENQSSITTLEAEIQGLDSKLPSAKKKEVAKINEEIRQKEEGIKFYEQEKALNQEDISKKNVELHEITSTISSMQTALDGGKEAEVSSADVAQVIAKINNKQDEIESSTVANQIDQLQSDYPDIDNPALMSIKSAEEMRSLHADELAALETTEDLTELERYDEEISKTVQTLGLIDEQIQSIESELSNNPENASLVNKKAELEAYKQELEDRTNTLQEKSEAIRNTVDPVAISAEDVLASLAPEYASRSDEINANSSLSEEEKLTQFQTLDEQLLESISNRTQELNEELSSDPTNTDLLGELSLLTTMKEDTQNTLADRTQRIDEIRNEQITAASDVKTDEEIQASVNEQLNWDTYQTKVATIENDASLSEIEKLQELQVQGEAVTQKIEARETALNESLIADPENEEIQRELAILTSIKEIESKKEEERTERINEIQNSATASTADAKTDEEIQASVNEQLNWDAYQIEVATIENDASLSEIEKLQELQAQGQAVTQKIEAREAALNESLITDPENEEIQRELAVLTSIKEAESEKGDERTERINEIENSATASTSDVKTDEEIKAGVDEQLNWEAYQEEVTRIENDASLSEVEKLNRLQEADQELAQTIEAKSQTVAKALEEDPENVNLQKEQALLRERTQETENRISDRIEQIEEASTSAIASEVKTVEAFKSAIEDQLDWTAHEAELTSVKENTSLSEIERLEEQQAMDVKLQRSLDKEIKKVEKELQENPTDQNTLNRKEALDELETTLTDRMAERVQTINALNSTTSITPTESVEEVKNRILSAVTSAYEAKKSSIEESESSEVDKEIQLLELEQAILTSLQEQKEEVAKSANGDPENAQLQTELDALTELIAGKETVISAQKEKAFEAIVASERYAEIVKEADKKYATEMEEILATPGTDQKENVIAREGELQENLAKEITALEKAQQRKYSITVELEAMVLRKELEESTKRANGTEYAATTGNTEEAQQAFVQDLQESLLEDNPTAMSDVYNSKEELEQQDEILEAYETALEEKIEELAEEISENQTEPLTQEKEWLEEELTAVKEKRRQIYISIGALETEVIANTESENGSARSTDQELSEIVARETEIKNELATEELSSSDRKRLENQLDEVQEERIERENVLMEAEIAAIQEERADLIAKVEAGIPDNQRSEVATQAIEAGQSEEIAINALVEEADKAKSEAEKNYLLEEAAKRQQALNDQLEEVATSEQIDRFEEENEIELFGQEELKARRRRVVIEIGVLETEVMRNQADQETAKKKELPSLQKEAESLEDKQQLLAVQLEKIDERLEEFNPVPTAIEKEAVDQNVSFVEEQVIASSEEYEAYQRLAIKALEVENEIASLDRDLNRIREEVRVLVASGKTEKDPEVQEKIQEIVTKEQQMDELVIRLEREKEAAIAVLPSNREESMKMQNLLARGVKPFKTTVAIASILQLPASGLAITPDATESTYSESTPIPIDVKEPSGLVYRVQIGAFAREIPQDLFKEFNPVSGESIGQTGITRYMAGFFNNSGDVVDAREQIRGLGYRDAFVVAYCDGERITFGEARRREANGTCVTKGENELLLEVAQNTAESLGIPLTKEAEELPELAYNQAPGAVEAQPIELKQGLFFTVQIGVYNRPVSDLRLKRLPEIMSIRLPNGQIRYSSGMFDSTSDALPRRSDAVEKGITDAYITAYYKGERISIAEARRLLAEKGNTILQSEIEKEEELPVVEVPDNVVRTDSVTSETIERPVEVVTAEQQKIQVVSKAQFEEFPRDILNRYNTEGNFYYDPSDKRVKSALYDDPNSLPRLAKFKKDVDTVYLSQSQMEDFKEMKSISVPMEYEKVPGDVMDWLIRLNYRKEIRKTNLGFELQIHQIEPSKLEEVQEQVSIFGLDSEVLIIEEEK